MVIHPKENILPRPSPLSFYELNMVKFYEREYIINGKLPPSAYYNKVLDCLRADGYKEDVCRLNDKIMLENIKAGKGIKPLRANSTEVKEEKEKTIIPRAEDVRANSYKILTFKFISHILYLLASFETKREINYAVKHGESYIFILDDDWRICYFPELIDRLKYLGYRVNKNIFGSYYVYWEDECPGEEI